MSELIEVEIVYALPHQQELLSVRIAQGSTVSEAIKCSGILEKYPEIDLSKNKFGVYGKLSKVDGVLRDKDRVEIYRPLNADPKEIRRQRAREGKAMKKGVEVSC